MDVSKDLQLKDKYFLTYILFYALGLVSNVPSNFFSTANDYWMYKFRDLDSNQSYNSDNKTTLQTQFTSDYSIVSNVGFAVFIIFTIHFLRSRINVEKRAMGSLGSAVAMFILTCIFVKVDTDSWQKGFFIFTLIMGFLLSAFCGVLMVTTYELAIKFPQKYLPAIFSGQSICGIFAALVQIFALGVGGGPETTGLIYFVIGLVCILLTLVGFLASLKKSEFFQDYNSRELQRRAPLVFNKDIILSALNKSKFYMFSMVIVLGSSIMLQPGVLTLVVSVDKGNGNPWNDTFFGPVVNFFLYYLFDYLGRESAIIIRKPVNGLVIFILGCIRLPLVPLILLCNVTPKEHLPVVFDVDYAYIIFVIIFAYSNGYLVNLCFVGVPVVTDDKERPFAMLCILLLMVLSLAVCSTTSAAIVRAL